MKMIAWNVYAGNGRLITTVFYNEFCDGGAPITRDMVKHDLINHDGYPTTIGVRKA